MSFKNYGSGSMQNREKMHSLFNRWKQNSFFFQFLGNFRGAGSFHRVTTTRVVRENAVSAGREISGVLAIWLIEPKWLLFSNKSVLT